MRKSTHKKRPVATSPSASESSQLDKKKITPTTETGTADAFCREHEGKIIYVPNFGWFFWNRRYWKVDDQRRIFYTIRKFCDALRRERRDLGLDAVRGFSLAAFHASVEQLSRSDPRMVVPSSKLDANPWLLVTPSGVVNLQTGEERPADPKDYCTKRVNVSPDKDEHCPWWKALLEYVCIDGNGIVDQEKIAFLQRMCGYFLTGSVREHAMFFIYGEGGNGKTTFEETLLSILGNDYATTLPLNTLMANKSSHHIPADIATLFGARLAVGSEVPSHATWDEAKIKHLTGGETITARKLYQQYFQFPPTHKLLIAGNAKPLLRVVDTAIKRRFHLIPFERKIENPDKNYLDILRKERPGILRWMINGALEWQKHGLNPPESISQQTEKYFEEQDIIQQWIDQRCIVNPSTEDYSVLLYKSWCNWCGDNGETPGPHRIFSQLLERKKFNKRKSHGYMMFGGIKAPQNEKADSDADST